MVRHFAYTKLRYAARSLTSLLTPATVFRSLYLATALPHSHSSSTGTVKHRKRPGVNDAPSLDQ